MILEGHGADIYRPDIVRSAQGQLFPGKSTIVFYVPPVGLPWLIGAGLIPLNLIRPFWWTALLACVAASLFVLQKAFNLSQISLVRLSAFVAAFASEWESIKHGQLAPLLLLGLSLACLAFRRNRQGLGGMCLSVFFLKPHFLLPLSAFLLGARKYKALLYLSLVALCFLAASWLMIGTQGFVNYWRLMSFSMNNSIWLQPELGPTIRGQMLRFFPYADKVILTLSTIILFSTYTLLCWLGHCFRLSPKWVPMWLITGIPLGILTSVYCHNYDLLLLVPTVAALIMIGFFVDYPPVARLIVFFVGFIFLMPVYGRIHYYYLMKGGVWNPLVFALTLFCAVMLFVARRERSANLT